MSNSDLGRVVIEWAVGLVVGVPSMLTAIAFVLGGIMWVIDYREEVWSFLRKHWRALVGCCVAVAAISGVLVLEWESRPKRWEDFWCVPKEEPVPELMQEAGRVSAEIKSKDAAWKTEMDKITTLIEAARPEKLDLAKEMATAEALRGYVEQLQSLGESAMKGVGRMKETAYELDKLLEKAPGLYRELAKKQRGYAKQEVWGDIKARYLTVADLLEARAKAAELHHQDVRESLNGKIESYLGAQNLFLERLLTSLNKGLGGSREVRDLAEFRKALQEIWVKHEFLGKTLEAWRARLMTEPETRPSSKEVAAATEPEVKPSSKVAATTEPETGPSSKELEKAGAPEAEAKEPRKDDDKRL